MDTDTWTLMRLTESGARTQTNRNSDCFDLRTNSDRKMQWTARFKHCISVRSVLAMAHIQEGNDTSRWQPEYNVRLTR